MASRAAGPADAATVCALIREGRVGLAGQRGGGQWLNRHASPEPLEPDVSHWLAAPNWHLQLATIDNAALGVLVAEHDRSEQERVATVHELFVVEEARGVGLGEEMMDGLLAWARATGCAGVDSIALPGDRATKNFFETHGLVARAIIVHRRLDEDA